jgi:hypothetical protein
MASTNSSLLELVPYPSANNDKISSDGANERMTTEWRVILRDHGRTVLYDSQHFRTAVLNVADNDGVVSPTTNTADLLLGKPHKQVHTCLLCGQLLPNAADLPAADPRHQLHELAVNGVFMDSNYFRLLASVIRHPSSTVKTTTGKTTASGSLHAITASDEHFVASLAAPDVTTQSPSAQQYADHLSTASFLQGYYGRFFREVRRLGRGYRGAVFLCQHVLDNVSLGEYAVKKIPVGDSKQWLMRMLREVHILERIHHFNIVDYKHCWLEDHSLTKFGK